MKSEEKSSGNPFIVESRQKEKKKSLASELMRLKRLKQKSNKACKIKNNMERELQQEKDESVPQRRHQPMEVPNLFDSINYIALEEFEGALEDSQTLQFYESAITEHQEVFVNKTVLHITSGCNCLYSIFCAKAGARKVYCVVNSASKADKQNIFMMQQILLENGLTEEEVEVLSFGNFNAEVDIIIGEPIGYVMHFDGMLDRIIEARDLYLDKQNGTILPNKVRFKGAFIKDEYFYDKKIEYWNEVYGVKMTTMKKWISHEPIVKVIDPNLIVSEVTKFLEYDLQTVTYEEISKVKTNFEISVLTDTEVNGLTIWFELEFSHEGSKTELKSSPWMDKTKFAHVTLYTNPKIRFKEREKVSVEMEGRRFAHEGVNTLKVSFGLQQTQYAFS